MYVKKTNERLNILGNFIQCNLTTIILLLCHPRTVMKFNTRSVLLWNAQAYVPGLREKKVAGFPL